MARSTVAEHLPGCPAALDIPGAQDECRCAELAALFRVPTRDECFGDEDPARARARWSAARAEAERRSDRLMHELAVDERRAFERLRETAADAEQVDRDIRTAKRLFKRMLAEQDRLRL